MLVAVARVAGTQSCPFCSSEDSWVMLVPHSSLSHVWNQAAKARAQAAMVREISSAVEQRLSTFDRQTLEVMYAGCLLLFLLISFMLVWAGGILFDNTTANKRTVQP